MSNPDYEPRPGDTDNNLLRKIANLLFAGLSGGGAVTGSVSIADPTTPANQAAVTNAAPSNTAYALAVRVVGAATGTAPVSIADGADVTQGAIADALTINPAASSTVVSILKGLLSLVVTRIPALGQAAMAASIPVAIASNQSAVPVSGTFFQATQPVSGTVAVSNFPATQPISGTVAVTQSTSPWVISGAVTQGTSPWVVSGTVAVTNANLDVALSTLSLKNQFPTTLGIAAKAASLSVAIANDQATATAPLFVELSDGAAGYTGAKTGQFPTALGATTKAASFSITIATDTYGQATKANSLPVTIASDQGNISTQAGTGTLTDRSGSIASGGTRQQMMASNASRKYLIIQNNSQENMWFNFTTNAVQSQPSFLLVPNGSFVMEGSYVSTEAIDVIAATTGSTWSAKEG